MEEQNKEAITIPKKHIISGIILLLVLVIVAVGAISYILGSEKSNPTGGFVGVPQKQSCPYECCLEGQYLAKSCEADYECKNEKCVAVDSDKDGLTDLQEKELGSNPLIFDTDSDGVNDYAETQKGTNLNNPNTDGDRYNDNIDSNPIAKNSAAVNIQLIGKEWVWDILGILKILDGDLNIRIATAKVDVSIQNNGNDHTDYVGFDIVFKLINNEVKRTPESIGRLNIGETQNKHYEYELKLADIPNTLINVIKQDSAQWDVQIQNVNYERFQ